MGKHTSYNAIKVERGRCKPLEYIRGLQHKVSNLFKEDKMAWLIVVLVLLIIIDGSYRSIIGNIRKTYDIQLISNDREINNLKTDINSLENERQKLLKEVKECTKQKETLLEENKKMKGTIAYDISTKSTPGVPTLNPVPASLSRGSVLVKEASAKEPKKSIQFNRDNLLESSNITTKELSTILKGTNLQSIAHAYIAAEKKYKVNALFLVSISALESGWGTSDMAKDKNNLTGFQAYNSNPKLSRSFSSKEENIIRTAHILKTDYLTKGGKYYNGLDIESVNQNYCLKNNNKPNYKWSKDVCSIANNLKKKAN